MYSISQFARLAQVSPKLLRHYDRLGLLQPSYINPETNYRYYELDQLAQLNRIIALKNLGLSLREVARLLAEDVSVDELRGMLRLKQAHLQQTIEAEQRKLREVETRLRQLQAADHPPKFDIALKVLAPERVVSLRRRIERGEDIIPLFYQIQAALKPHPLGQSMGLYHLAESRERDGNERLAFTLSNGRQVSEGEFPGADFCDAEAAFIVNSEPSSVLAPMMVYDLPTIEAATLVYQGPYAYRHHAYWAFTHWAEGNQYRVCGAVREVYLRVEGHPNNPDNLLEVQIPVERFKEK